MHLIGLGSINDYTVEEAREKARERASCVMPGKTYHGGGVLCLECRACGRRTALTKQECPEIRPNNGRYVLHATFRCRFGADRPRIYQATRDEATMFLAGDPLPARRQIGR